MNLRGPLLFVLAVGSSGCTAERRVIPLPELTSQHVLLLIVDESDEVVAVDGPHESQGIVVRRDVPADMSVLLAEISREGLVDQIDHPSTGVPVRAEVDRTECGRSYSTNPDLVRVPLRASTIWEVHPAGAPEEIANDSGRVSRLNEQVRVTVPLSSCPVPTMSSPTLIGDADLAPLERVRGAVRVGDQTLVVTAGRLVLFTGGQRRVVELEGSVIGFAPGDPPLVSTTVTTGTVARGSVREVIFTADSVELGRSHFDQPKTLGHIARRPGGGLAVGAWKTLHLVEPSGDSRELAIPTDGAIATISESEPLFVGTTDGEIVLVEGESVSVSQLLDEDVPFRSLVNALTEVAGRFWANTNQGVLFLLGDDGAWVKRDVPLPLSVPDCMRAVDACGDPGVIGPNGVGFGWRNDPAPMFVATSEACGVTFAHHPVLGCAAPLFAGLVPRWLHLDGDLLLIVTEEGDVYEAALSGP